MLLYTKIRKQVTVLSKLKEPLPVSYNLSFAMAYLGAVSSIMEVQLKAGKKEMGWLYSKSSIVIYEYEGKLYEVWLSDLKEYAEDVLKEKKFCETPTVGFLDKNKDTGAITGFLDTEGVIKISIHIQES